MLGSGPSAARARCRARCSGSVTAVARRRCASRREAPSVPARETDASRGWVKRTRLSVTSITSASIAGRSSSDGSAAERAGEQVDRTVAGESRQAKRVERSGRQERKPSRDELLQRGRDRERLAGRDRNGAPIERPPELEREERIPARRVDDLEQRRPGQCESEALAEQRLHGAHVESAELDARQALALERRPESERALLCIRSRRDEDSHRLSCEADGTRTRAPHATTCQASGHRRARRARAVHAPAPEGR